MRKRPAWKAVAAAAGSAFALTAPWVWAQQSGMNDDFVRPSQSTVRPVEPGDSVMERGSHERSSDLDAWVRDESDLGPESEPVPVRKLPPPQEKGLERARERADEHAEDGLDRAAERAADEELDRSERAQDRPGFDNRAAQTEGEGEEEDSAVEE